MTTTEMLADRVARGTIRVNVQAIDPLTIVALINAITQVIIACMPQPERAATYLRGDDLRLFPNWRYHRRVRRIEAAIARVWGDCGGSVMRLGDVQRAVLLECATVTPEVMHGLYEENRRGRTISAHQ